jgi:GNAT superfamily N-acetyltransferase
MTMQETDPAIREMTRDDIEAIMPLMIQLGYEVNIDELGRRFGTVISTAGHHLLVCEQEGHILGFCHMFARPALEKPPEAIVQSLVVDVEARSDGVGRALIGAVENWAKQQGLASVSLSSQVDREDAHAFYDSLGYERVATSSLLRKRLES